ncbi:sporulation membrane protein YtrI [Ectobacillus panaciterrae]|uniref:sporulation membrane protein YtrI n=1 Tax=Ectobacillus panaciterrae TaxID=363872 RepID=UPI0004051359|nr:sporulation membrane protein YtrI [Ectobacillus panaciterrae]
MRIPPLYKSRFWQAIFGGMAVGGIISWIIFLYIYGEFQEEQRKLIFTQQNEIDRLEKAYHLLMEDKQKLNEENKRILTIQDIKIEILNHEQYDLDSLAVHGLMTDVKSDLQSLLTKSVQSVATNKELLQRAIENKVYKRADRSYRFEVRTMYFDTVLEISLKIKRE